MSVFLWITAFAFVLFILFLLGLIWSFKNDQYEDLDLPAHRILWEDIRKK